MVSSLYRLLQRRAYGTSETLMVRYEYIKSGQMKTVSKKYIRTVLLLEVGSSISGWWLFLHDLKKIHFTLLISQHTEGAMLRVSLAYIVTAGILRLKV